MSKLRIQTMVLGMVSTNTYILYREGESQAVIVDPADYPDRILDKCRELKLTPAAIVLTHGHFDHIGAVEGILKDYPVEVIAGEKEEKLIKDPGLNLSGQFGRGYGVKLTRPVKDGEEFSLLDLTWKVLETPGHTAGSVCYYIAGEGILLSGDTLFRESYGRTDFPGGSSRQLTESIGRLFQLPEDTAVYPGHDMATTIGHEKQYNPMGAYISRTGDFT